MKPLANEKLLEMDDISFVEYVEHWWGHHYRARMPETPWLSREDRDRERLQLLESLRALHGVEK
jgi:hypothetical protein